MDERLRDLKRAAANGGWPERLALAVAEHRCGACRDEPYTPREVEALGPRFAEFGHRMPSKVDGCPHSATWVESFARSTAAATINDRLERCNACGVVVGSLWIPAPYCTSDSVIHQRTRAPETIEAHKRRSEASRKAWQTRMSRRAPVVGPPAETPGVGGEARSS